MTRGDGGLAPTRKQGDAGVSPSSRTTLCLTTASIHDHAPATAAGSVTRALKGAVATASDGRRGAAGGDGGFGRGRRRADRGDPRRPTARPCWRDLPPEEAADVAEYLDPDTAGAHPVGDGPAAGGRRHRRDMEAPEASMVLAAMDPDDRVDVLEHVPGTLHDAHRAARWTPRTRRRSARLRAVPAGHGRRDHDHARSRPSTRTSPSRRRSTQLRRLNEELEQMFYVYVVDRRGHLVGVLSMRDLILARPAPLLRDIMRPNVAQRAGHDGPGSTSPG